MSIYGFLVCHDCRQFLWLGKAIHEDAHVHYFHIGPQGEPLNWNREILNQVVWKFLADHSGHRIEVLLEHKMTEEMFGYQDLEGDGEYDKPFHRYLEGWRGLGS